ncbi:MAG: NUDIX domain-containing protein [Gemmatimonadales bacterium]|nr:MAG: NUDIX domain-containing protein [Gemmatimonadales bacterium]
MPSSAFRFQPPEGSGPTADPGSAHDADRSETPGLERPLPPGSVPVVAAVARRDHRVLIALRGPGRRHAGLWEFPGGKVREGEGLDEAMRRELTEELGVGASEVGRPLFQARDPGSPFVILFIPVRLSGNPRALEHERLAWRAPEELDDLPLAPSDARFVREYLLAQNS